MTPNFGMKITRFSYPISGNINHHSDLSVTTLCRGEALKAYYYLEVTGSRLDLIRNSFDARGGPKHIGGR